MREIIVISIACLTALIYVYKYYKLENKYVTTTKKLYKSLNVLNELKNKLKNNKDLVNFIKAEAKYIKEIK